MKTGTRRIIIGSILIFAGIILIPLAVIIDTTHSLIHPTPEQQFFTAPGQTEILASSPGRWYLWHWYRTTHDGSTYNRPPELPDGISIEITTSDTGDPIPLVPDTSLSVTSPAGSRKSVGYVQILQPAYITIRLKADSPQPYLFTFSPSRIPSVAGHIILGGILSLLVGFLGVAILVWGLSRRIKAGRTARIP